jgi:hypothetical protein
VKGEHQQDYSLGCGGWGAQVQGAIGGGEILGCAGWLRGCSSR